MTGPFSHCPACGRRFPDPAARPLTCACGAVTHRNPTPVVVLLVPVAHGGLLLVRRAQPPLGLALPSGFIESGEHWRAAAARELAEETGVRVEPATLRPFDVHSGRDDTLLVFAAAPAVPRSALGNFTPSDEVSELLVRCTDFDDLVFPLDTEAAVAWARGRRALP
jgi:ADP-ribose pyrophosphatase YjhB (NUDIX family)